MTRYIVFEPPAKESDAPVGAGSAASDRAVFLRDAFAKWAVLFPFLWLFRHGLILSGLLVLAASVGLGALAERPELGIAAGVLPLLLGALIALEGPSLRAARYRRKGFRETAVVEAEDEETAAMLYYARNASAEPQARRGAPAAVEGRTARSRPMSLLDPAGRR